MKMGKNIEKNKELNVKNECRDTYRKKETKLRMKIYIYYMYAKNTQVATKDLAFS